MNKRFFMFVYFLCFLSTVIFALGGQESIKKENGKISIAVTFDAIKELTLAVAGDKADISVLIPEGMEPHDFEPKAKDLVFLSNAELLIYNGFGMEFWLESALKAVNNKSLITVQASKGIEPIKLVHEEEHEHGHKHSKAHSSYSRKHSHSHHEHNHGEYDPHVWLSLNSAKIMVKNIEKALSKADPENSDTYKSNTEEYIKNIDLLLEEYSVKFKSLENRTLVVSHAAFGYLCRDFNFSQKAVTDVFAEGEPGPKEMAKLIDYCKDNNIKVIFAEETVSPVLAETLAKEVNAKVVKIYTMESPEENMSYFDRMKENLFRIYNNLKNIN